MANLSERQRNNVKAGVFVTIALILGMGVVVVLTDALERFQRSTTSYSVVFSVASGVPNIKRGSEVRVGGMIMGRVQSVAPIAPAGVEPLQDIEVRFDLDSKAVLRSNASIFVASPLIGAEGWLDIPSVGTADQPEATGPIKGETSAGFLTALLGGANKDRADEIIENVRRFSAFLPEVETEYQSRVVPILDNVATVSADAKEIVSDLRENRWPNWAAHVDEIMAWAGDLPAKVDEAIAQGTGLLSDARSVIAENREPVLTTIANAKEISERVKTETVDKVHKLLDTGQEGLESAKATLRDVQVDYAAWATDLGETLANATIASQQLKLATIEVRRSPWKLLYRPTPDELQHELLYESARSFAVAASDVKAASASLQRVMDSNSAASLTDVDAFKRLQQNLVESLARYEAAQQRMLDVIIADQTRR